MFLATWTLSLCGLPYQRIHPMLLTVDDEPTPMDTGEGTIKGDSLQHVIAVLINGHCLDYLSSDDGYEFMDCSGMIIGTIACLLSCYKLIAYMHLYEEDIWQDPNDSAMNTTGPHDGM